MSYKMKKVTFNYVELGLGWQVQIEGESLVDILEDFWHYLCDEVEERVSSDPAPYFTLEDGRQFVFSEFLAHHYFDKRGHFSEYLQLQLSNDCRYENK